MKPRLLILIIVTVSLFNLGSMLSVKKDYASTSARIGQDWLEVELKKLMDTEAELMCWKETMTVSGKTMTMTRFPKIPCEVDGYWKIISHGEESLYPLINSLNNHRPTQIYLQCKDGNLNVGEICYLMLQQVIDVPLSAITGRQYCLWDSCSTYDYFPTKGQYIQEFQQQLTQYYDTHTYYFEEYKELESCRVSHGITGRLRINY